MEYFKLTKVEEKEWNYPTQTPFIVRQGTTDSYYFVSKQCIFDGEETEHFVMTHMENGVIQSSTYKSIEELFKSRFNFRLVNSEIIIGI